MSWSLKNLFFDHASGTGKTHVVLRHKDSGEEKDVYLSGNPEDHRDMSVLALERLAVEQIDLA